MVEGDGQWQSEFFGCCSSPMACYLTILANHDAMAFIHCENRNLIEGDGGMVACCIDWWACRCGIPCLLCTMGFAWNRAQVRQAYNLQGNMCVDWLLYLPCGWCMAVQEYREVRMREAAKGKNLTK